MEEERKAKREQNKQMQASNRHDKRGNFTITVSKTCSQNFKSQTRDHREKVLSKLDSQGNGAPEVGKYNPKHDSLRRYLYLFNSLCLVMFQKSSYESILGN